MPDEVKQNFVRSFVGFLKSQIGSNDMAADAQESVEVAIQCLQAAFDIEEDEGAAGGDVDVASGSSGNVASGGAAAGTSTGTGTNAGPRSTASRCEATPSGSENASKKIDIFELFESIYAVNNPNMADLAESIKNQGNRLMEEGKYNEALLQYNRAISFNPKNPIYYCNRAAAYIRLSDNERAITDCKSALVYNPSYSKAYGRLGIAYSNLGKYEEAEQAYSKAIELEPNNQDYRNNLEVARHARTSAPMNAALPQLSVGLNALLSNPTIRNIFSSTDIDLEHLQGMSQNPVIMNAIGQMFTGMHGGGVAMGSGPLSNDALLLFQTFASQLASAVNADSSTNNSGNNNQSERQPPSSS